MTYFRPIISIRVAPGPKGARQARMALDDAIRNIEYSDHCRNGLRLFVAEWITNLGMHPRQKPSYVDLEMHLLGNAYHFEVWDDGGCFPELAAPATAGDLPEELAESGLGLKLITFYFPALSYFTSERGNCLRIQCHTNDLKDKTAVLLVDDEPLIRTIYSQYICQDYRIFLAESAQEAEQILKRTPVDLIISDINMPNGSSGLELCARIRREPKLATLPFIFLTNNRTTATRQTAQDLAIDDYLLKPVHKETLLNSTRRVIGNSRFIRKKLGDRFDAELTQLLRPALPPKLGIFRTAVQCYAAESGGGDLIFYRQKVPKCVVILADLMGHGAQAKFYSHALTGYLSGMMSAADQLGMEGILLHLNKSFADDPLLRKTLATVLLVELHDDGRIQITNAGHPRPLRIGPRGCELLEVTGPLLGVADDAHYPAIEFHLEAGERLCLYTDGLSEIGMTEIDRQRNFQEFMSGLKGTLDLDLAAASEFLNQLVARLTHFQCQDDITFVLLEPDLDLEFPQIA